MDMQAKAVLLSVLVACGGAPTPARDPASRGLRADQHLVEAREHDHRAGELTMWPDGRSIHSAGKDPAGELAISRWSSSWDTAREHARLAQHHRGQAAVIQAEFDEACRDIPTALVTVSPLQRYGMGGAPTSTGVLVFLAPYPGEASALLAELRCHRAWMRLGPATMDDCPLDLPGIHVDARGAADAITLHISIDDPKLVPELQRRTARDLESATRRRDHGHR